MKEQEQIFYVQLNEPQEVRKNLLEALKDIVVILQKIEKFKEMREKKLDDIQKLRAMMRQANKLMGDLKDKLPPTELKPVTPKTKFPVKEAEVSPLKKDKIVEQPARKKDMTELEKLESELSDIENKLKSLQ